LFAVLVACLIRSWQFQMVTNAETDCHVRYRELLPDPRLRPAIKCYWFLQGTMAAPEPDRILPDGCCELIFHCGDHFTQQLEANTRAQPRRLLIGPTTHAVVVSPGHSVDVIGIRFRPAGSALLGGAPARELRDSALDAQDAGVRIPAELLEVLASLGSDRDRARVLDRVLLRRLENTSLDHQMLALQRCIVESGGELRTRWLAQVAGLSMRQLQRRFHTATGLTPKLLSRLVRLQRALVVVQERHNTLASVAASAGYADQAHFTRDFREFAGVSPSEYFRGERQLSDYFVGADSID
jgi:AraC-like DNA-binding protein